MYASISKKEEKSPAHRKKAVQREPINLTGIPIQMKRNFENLSGFSFDDVRVHYQSGKPAQFQALAYTQGSNVFIGPGQEKYLGHELGHVVQQKRGIMPQIVQSDNRVYSNEELEKDADRLWAASIGQKGESVTDIPLIQRKEGIGSRPLIIQRKQKPWKEVLEMNLQDFNKYRKAEEMDWANTPGINEKGREIIWELLDWGTDALGDFSIKEIIESIGGMITERRESETVPESGEPKAEDHEEIDHGETSHEEAGHEEAEHEEAGHEAIVVADVPEAVEAGPAIKGPVLEIGKPVDELRQQLRIYCIAVNGEYEGKETVILKREERLEESIKEGKWIEELHKTIADNVLIRATISYETFKKLIANEDVAKDFMVYYSSFKPIIESTTGCEIEAFINLRTMDGASMDDLRDYKTKLPDIRNFHKFYKSSLTKLVADKHKTNEAITLIMISAFDHNGALTRNSQTKRAIESENLCVWVAEGKIEKELVGFIHKLEEDLKGENGRKSRFINQVIIDGHGSSKSMEVCGKGTEGTKNQGKYRTRQIEPKRLDLSEGKPYERGLWALIFFYLKNDMKPWGWIHKWNPRIVLHACLTASNSINQEQLTKTILSRLPKSGDLPDEAVDKTVIQQIEAKTEWRDQYMLIMELKGYQDIIRQAIRDQFESNGSLTSVLKNMLKSMGADIEVIGAQASISGKTTRIITDDGRIGLYSNEDPYITDTKETYIIGGKMPDAVLKAVIECMAEDREKALSAVDKRLKKVTRDYRDLLIHLLLNDIDRDNILKANRYVNTACVLNGVCRVNENYTPAHLSADEVLKEKYEEYYSEIWRWKCLGDKRMTFIVIYQDWFARKGNADKMKEFLGLIEDKDIVRTQKYMDFNILNNYADQILGIEGYKKNKAFLAVIMFTSFKIEAAKTYLMALMNKGEDEISGEERKVLSDYGEARLKKLLGLEVEAPSRREEMNNITGQADLYVCPIVQKTLTLIADTAVREFPVDSAKVIEVRKKDNTIILVGQVKNLADHQFMGYYMVRTLDYRVGYAKLTGV